MSVTVCKERPAQRTASERDDYTREYRRVFYVETSSKYDDAVTVLNAPGLPALFSFYNVGTSSDMAALCKSREPSQIGPTQWEVQLTYDSKREDPTKPDSSGGGGSDSNPDMWYEKVSISFNGVDEVVYAAYSKNAWNPYIPGVGNAAGNNKRAVTNSAGEPFDPPLTKLIYHPIVTFNIYRRTFDVKQAMDYVGSTNSDIFWGATAGQLRINKYETSGIEYKIISGIYVWYYPITIEMEYHVDTWDLQPLDYGTYYNTGSSPIVKNAFVTKEGQPYNGLLNGQGGKLADGADPVYLRFRVYPEKPFSSLGLPASMPVTPKLLGIP